MNINFMKVKMRILFIILSVGIVPFLSLQGALPDPDPDPPPATSSTDGLFAV